MSKVNFGYSIDRASIEVGRPVPSLQTMAEDIFFNEPRPAGVYPLPRCLKYWNKGRYDGEEILVGIDKDDLYIIGMDQYKGETLIHYILNEGTRYRYAATMPMRSISRKDSTMAMNSMQPGFMPPIPNFGGVAPMNYTQPTFGGNDGVTSGASTTAIEAKAQVFGYIYGYVSRTAPAISIRLVNLGEDKTTKQHRGYRIEARQSKPSRPMKVLMGIPKSCCMKGSSFASPTDIESGNVDFNPNDNQIVARTFEYDVAVRYLIALGGRLPEYQPTHGGGSKHDPKVFAENPDSASFITLKSGTRRTKDGEIPCFNLKSTSGRGTWLHKDNVMCLRGLKHVSAIPKTEAEEYNLCQGVFCPWEKQRAVNSSDGITTAQRAMQYTPDWLWLEKYGPDQTEGYRSCLFLHQESLEANGHTIPKTALEFMPWYRNNLNKGQVVALPMKRIVGREFRPGVKAPAGSSKKDTEDRWSTITLKLTDTDKENESARNEVFGEFEAFRKSAIAQKYFTEEDVSSWVTSKATKKAKKDEVLNLEELRNKFNQLGKDALIEEAISRYNLRSQVM